LLRNAAIVLGNQKSSQSKPVLIQALKKETDSIILDACQYALAEIAK
jgi:HEAT repeat protein